MILALVSDAPFSVHQYAHPLMPGVPLLIQAYHRNQGFGRFFGHPPETSRKSQAQPRLRQTMTAFFFKSLTLP